MFIFAIILALFALLAVIGCIISEESPLIPFSFLVFFVLYLMGVGS
jgi:hypothetical protein